MLPWWFWVLLWVVLVLGMLLFLVLAGIRLFRGFMKLLEAAGEAGDLMSSAMEPAADPVDYGVLPERAPAGVAALFRDPDEAREAFDAGKAQRIENRRVRRVERKAARGQAQRFADLDLI